MKTVRDDTDDVHEPRRLEHREIGGEMSRYPHRSVGLALLVLIACLASCSRSPSPSAAAPEIRLATSRFDGGFFSIDRPKGWELDPAGACSEFAFFLHDPDEPMRQVFFFGQAGPIYTHPMQRGIDQGYMAMGGYPTPWVDMPLVSPLTAAGFLEAFPALLASESARSFMPSAPRLDEVRVVSSEPLASAIPGGETALLHAIVGVDGRVAEGLFSITVASLLPFSGSPGGGIGAGFLITGITAPKEEFPGLVDDLVACIESFTVDESYARNCMAQQNQTYQGILQAGRTLSETSDLIMEGWESRSRTHDILSEKWSDTILGKERMVDPDTGNVYAFDLGFQDRYENHREEYRLQNLQPLPDDDYDVWMTPPLDGEQHL
jgi:hypothetical protein